MNVTEIREKFLSYFESKGHTRVASSSLVPGNDPTLLFTNSGMVQFKDVFVGKETRPYKRATTAQRSVRAGGKHNDLENVGYTARHHTFFEMLGNFSFGDYFKQDAIRFAWELLTEVYKLPKEKLWVTVYIEDDEAYGIWEKEIGVPPERIVRIGDNKGAKYASDNFWQMADTGPCGPCSEIFYDHGPEVAGGPPGSPEQDGDRYIEVWNLVFMQFDRQPDGSMPRLPKPCVDTGMGLERIAAVLQHVHSNYEIDLFAALIKAAGRETNTTDLSHNSLKVIADHIRAASFLIVDGVIPSAEKQGSVLRRIIRRALRHGYKLGQHKPFLHNLVKDLVALMGSAYPELVASQKRVEETLLIEEERFAQTLGNGMKLLEKALAQDGNMIDGDTVFTLHDTYGFPQDLTADVARERGKTIDVPGFEQRMKEQQDTSKGDDAFKDKKGKGVSYEGAKTVFHGYESFVTEGAKVVALYQNGVLVDSLSTGESGIVVLDQTPFYAESGGQVGDKGELVAAGGTFNVADTQKIQPDVYGHNGTVKAGQLKVGDTVEAKVDTARRAAIARNHSVTHLMHKALREVLGDHVAQRGSLVDDEKTRFDFVQNKPLTATEIRRVEEIVNAEILQNQPTRARVLPIEEAKKTGAMMLFGEKYGDEVRVLDIGSSRELCGGTHVSRTGDIGPFKIYAEGGVAAGVRRVEATTGTTALHMILDQTQELGEIARSLKVGTSDVEAAIGKLQEEKRNLEKELAKLKGKLASSQGDELVNQAVDVKGIKVLTATLEGADSKALLETMDKLKDKLKTAAIVLATVNGGKAVLVAGVTKDATAKLKAGDLLNFVAQQVGGKGGGKPEMAQGSGSEPDKLPAALKGVEAWVAERA